MNMYPYSLLKSASELKHTYKYSLLSSANELKHIITVCSIQQVN